MRTPTNASERVAAGPVHLLTLEQVAARIGCKRTTVFRLLREQAFPSSKVGRNRLVPLAAVDAYLEQLHAGDRP